MLWECWYTKKCASNWWHLLHKSIAGHLRSWSVFAGPCSFEWGWIHFRYEVPKCWVHSRGVDSHTPYIVNFISSIWGDRLHGIDWSICCPSSIEVLWIARNPHNFCHINTYGHAVIRTSSSCWWPNKAVVGCCRAIPDPKFFESFEIQAGRHVRKRIQRVVGVSFQGWHPSSLNIQKDIWYFYWDSNPPWFWANKSCISGALFSELGSMEDMPLVALSGSSSMLQFPRRMDEQILIEHV